MMDSLSYKEEKKTQEKVIRSHKSCQDKYLKMLDTLTHLLKLLENAFGDEGDLDELASGRN